MVRATFTHDMQAMFLYAAYSECSLTFSITDLKSTSDDALTPYLCTLPQPYTFRRDNTKTNVRFIVGYTAVAIAGVTFYLDRQLGWEATEALWVKLAVGVYFILNSILTYWIWAIEAGEVFKGSRKSGESVRSFIFPLN